MVRGKLAAVIVAALAVFAPAAGADSLPDVSVGIAAQPATVTVGHTVSVTTTFSNKGASALDDVDVRIAVPAGATLISSQPGSCVAGAGSVLCTFGTVAGGAGASATLLLSAPADPGTMALDAVWSADTETDGPDYGDDLTFEATGSATVAAVSPDLVSEFVLPAGQTLTTDPGTGATTANPQVTTAVVPPTTDGTPATLSETDASGPGDACGAGKSCFGQISNITIGTDQTASDPFRFTFLLDRSELPKGIKVRTLPVYHDGVLVPNCTGGPTVASPDPCVLSRTRLKNRDVQIIVLSSTNGRWRP